MDHKEHDDLCPLNNEVTNQAYEDLCNDLDILIKKYQERMGPALWVFTVVQRAAEVAYGCAPNKPEAAKLIREAVKAGKDV